MMEAEAGARALFARHFSGMPGSTPVAPPAAHGADPGSQGSTPGGGVVAAAATGAEEGLVCATAPGRTNIIGGHTDYNDGHVMPMALLASTVCVARLRSDGQCRIVSAFAPDAVVAFTLDDASDSLVAGVDSSWAKYVKGVIKQYFEEIVARRPLPVPSSTAKSAGRAALGFDAAFASDVPMGGGLSSSASLEVCTAITLETLYSIDATAVSNVQRALRCVEAEHTFAGVPCGVMDQFISSCAVEGKALLIDCRSHATTEVDMCDPNLRIVLTNSNKQHELSGSEYPDRVRQCAEAVAAINAACPQLGGFTEGETEGTVAAAETGTLSGSGTVPGSGKESGAERRVPRTHLRDATLAELEQTKAAGKLGDVVYRRARHILTEQVRAVAAAAAAAKGDYASVGKLVQQTHVSLRDDFEISTPEIDFLVDAANNHAGVYGSRLTGGGFGGCTVTLVHADQAGPLMESLQAAYKERFGIDCTCFATTAGAGARVLWDTRSTPSSSS